MLGGFGSDCGGTFGAKLEPVLEVLLLLGKDGYRHLTAPRVGGTYDVHAMSTLNNLS